jgi:tRNA-dihydrouridine synthase
MMQPAEDGPRLDTSVLVCAGCMAGPSRATSIGEEFGYDEINLNVGCPSDRVKDGRFGARLMAEPALVAAGAAAMKGAVKNSRHGQMPDPPPDLRGAF